MAERKHVALLLSSVDDFNYYRRQHMDKAMDLSGANLCGANLVEAYLSGVDLRRANLARADLVGAYLAGANLSEADLARSFLRDAQLTFADLTDASLFGADLTNAKDINLRGAHIEITAARTLLPSTIDADTAKVLRKALDQAEAEFVHS